MNALFTQGTLTRLARWVRVHRRLVIAGWIAAVVVAMAAAHSAGTRNDNNLSLSGTESQRATAILQRQFPSQGVTRIRSCSTFGTERPTPPRCRRQ